MRSFKLFPEKEIINRVQANDRTVLGELFIRYKKMVFSYIQTNGGSEQDGEDMLQEAIIVFWQKVCSGSFELTSKIGTFLLAVVKNKWYAEIRKRNKFTYTEISDDVIDEKDTQLDIVISEEKKHSVRKALEAIDPGCKQLLLYFYFEQRNMEEITKIMKFANSNVTKSKKYQCKKTLESILRKTAEAERRM